MFRYYKRQKEFIKENIFPDLENFKKNNDTSLSEKDFDKIRNYYGLTLPTIADIFCTFRGAGLTHSERETITYLGALTGLFDDFFDEKGTKDVHIKELLDHPDIENAGNSHEKLFIRYYRKAFGNKHSNSLEEYRDLIFKAQILSKKQTGGKLSFEEILHITEQKGGNSVLFVRAALKGEILKPEKELLFKLGLLAQLEDDIFDIYKDHQEGVQTLATTTDSITSLRSLYRSLVNEIYELSEGTDFPKKNKKKFAGAIAVIAARGLVCLDQLVKLDHEGKFEISGHSREQLVCDMGKLKNNLKWVHFSVLQLAG